MKLSLGEFFAECPYCGGTEFVPPDRAGDESREVACAQCGGSASRAVVLERLADKAAEASRLVLARLKEERVKKRGAE